MKDGWGRLKRGWREEQEKLRPMSGKERFDYIKTYYRRTIFFTIFFAFLFISFGAMLWNNRLERTLSCAILNNIPGAAVDSYIEKEFAAYLPVNPKKERIFVDSDYLFDLERSQETLSQTTYLQKYVTAMADSLLDVVITDESVIKHYSLHGSSYLDLSKFLTKEEQGLLSPYFYYTEDEEGGSHPFALHIKDTSLGQHEEFFIQEPLLAIPITSRHLENARAFLYFVFQLDRAPIS